jgi:predicted MFS family arabinose efflux permease
LSASAPAVALANLTATQRNLALDLSSAVGLGGMFAVVGVLLPSVARREGLDSMGLAVLAALPFLASLVTLFAGRIGARTPARMALLRSMGAAGVLLVVIAPQPLFIAVAILGFWMMFALGAPMQQRIWATIYPSRDRGRMLGYVGTARSTAGTVALLAITLLAATSGWVAIVAVVVVIGAVCSLAIGRLAAPGIDIEHRFGALESIRSVTSQPMLRRITAAQLLFGSGFVAAPALIAMVHVDRLGLRVEDIALAGLVSYGSTAVTFSLWGRLAGRAGALMTIASGSLVGVVAMLLFAVAPTFPIVLLATVLLGAAGAAVDTAWPLLIADHAPAERQGEVAAGLNAIMGFRGLLVPFVVMAPIAIGLTDVTGGLLISVASMAAGAVIYARISGLWRVPGRVLARVGALRSAQPRQLADAALVDLRLAAQLPQTVDAIDDGRMGAEETVRAGIELLDGIDDVEVLRRPVGDLELLLVERELRQRPLQPVGVARQLHAGGVS